MAESQQKKKTEKNRNMDPATPITLTYKNHKFQGWVSTLLAANNYIRSLNRQERKRFVDYMQRKVDLNVKNLRSLSTQEIGELVEDVFFLFSASQS
jgi:hypothetical protein